MKITKDEQERIAKATHKVRMQWMGVKDVCVDHEMRRAIIWSSTLRPGMLVYVCVKGCGAMTNI